MKKAYIRLDVHKTTISIALAFSGNDAPISYGKCSADINRFPIELAAEIALSAMSEVEFDIFFVNMEQEKHECYVETYSRITSRI